MGPTHPIPKEVQGGRWLWPKDSSDGLRQEAARTLAHSGSPTAFSALSDCLPIAHEPEKNVREACAEGLLKLDPKKAVPTLWAARKIASAEAKEPYRQWEGGLVGVLLVYGVKHENKSLTRSAERLLLYGDGWKGMLTRSSAFEYIMRHPHPRLEKYAIMGLRWDTMTRDTTAFFLRKWPYSRPLVTAMVAAYDVSSTKEFLVAALGRMKARNPAVLDLLRRGLGLMPDTPATADDGLREKIAEVLVFDLQDSAGLAAITSVIQSDETSLARRVLFVRRLGLQKTDWALKALLDFAGKFADGELRYEVALALHRNFPTDPKVPTTIRPIFESALKDKTASPYIRKECGARLSQLR